MRALRQKSSRIRRWSVAREFAVNDVQVADRVENNVCLAEKRKSAHSGWRHFGSCDVASAPKSEAVKCESAAMGNSESSDGPYQVLTSPMLIVCDFVPT
jgi:hypothetical protein